MEMRIGPGLEKLLAEKGLSFKDLIVEFFNTIPITHLHVGQAAGIGQAVGAVADKDLQQDLYVAHASPPRSLLERILVRFKAQHALDREALPRHPEFKASVDA